MKFLVIFPLASLATALFIPQPDQHVFENLAIETRQRSSKLVEKVTNAGRHLLSNFRENVDNGVHHVKSYIDSYEESDGPDLPQSGLPCHEIKALVDAGKSFVAAYDDPHHDPPHHDPPHHEPPQHDPHHGHKSDLTVYQLISESNYTTKFAALIDEYPDLVETLNSTKSNFTIWAPTDKAFEKIPEHHPKPSKEELKNILLYHVSPDLYPAGRVLVTRTVPTLLDGHDLSEDEKHPQRLSINIGLRGLTLNYYARIVAVDIFGSNGVIHGLADILVPPPNSLKIIDLFPSEFSTLELALLKTDLLSDLKSHQSRGGTFFAPSNFAFAKLGPRVNAFLFSPHGLKYLKALLKYHIVPHTTLYSDAVYGYNKKEHEEGAKVPKGLSHFDLPTLLEDKKLNVDVGRYGGLVGIRINGFSDVTLPDGVAKDGVVHVVSNVLIPPKRDGYLGLSTPGEVTKVGELKEWLRDVV